MWVVFSQLGKQHRPQFHYKKYNFILGGTVATNGNDDQVQTRKFTVAPGKTMEVTVVVLSLIILLDLRCKVLE